mgnify:CR=1 FL=1
MRGIQLEPFWCAVCRPRACPGLVAVDQAYLEMHDETAKQIEAIEDRTVKVMVMADLPEPRPAYVLDRGQYDARRDEVAPAVPAFLPPLPEGAASMPGVIIPRKTIMELQRLLEDTDDLVTLQIATNQLKVEFADIELMSKLVEGKFPDYTRVIPKAYKNNFTIGRELLLRSLQRAAIMTSDKFKGVRCVIAPGSLKISSTNSDQEEAVEELEIDYGGDSVDIGFNVTYLIDVLGNMSQDMVRMDLAASNSSALITIPDNSNFKYVVMPMRI